MRIINIVQQPIQTARGSPRAPPRQQLTLSRFDLLTPIYNRRRHSLLLLVCLFAASTHYPLSIPAFVQLLVNSPPRPGNRINRSLKMAILLHYSRHTNVALSLINKSKSQSTLFSGRNIKVLKAA